MTFNSYDLTTTSLVKSGNLTEMYIPLWYYSSSYGTSAGARTAGTYWVPKGNTVATSPINSAMNLHTLNSHWSSNQQFAFEGSIAAGTTNTTSYASLWDITSNTLVTASQISVTPTDSNYYLMRSGKFTLTPGHVYGITIWNTGANCFLTKASLIAFLS